jgi:hypothetical protein
MTEVTDRQHGVGRAIEREQRDDRVVRLTGTAAVPTLKLAGDRSPVTFNGDGWRAPRIVGRTIGIDTISQGVLTAIRLPDRQLFQSARYGSR